MFVAEGNRFKRKDCLTRLVHGLDRFLETLRRASRAKATVGIYLNYYIPSGPSVNRT
jgi:hypothetical protein